MRLFMFRLTLLIAAVAFSACVYGQQLPDAPSASVQSATLHDGSWSMLSSSADAQSNRVSSTPSSTPLPDDAGRGVQTKRILGIIPNFRSVSADVTLPPLTTKQKFVEATQDSFDYSSAFLPAVLALIGEQTDSTTEFGHGGVGYGRYLWHAAADQTIENYMVEFVVPAITREDPRYYTLGKHGFVRRTGYAISRAVITRTDKGTESFNYSEVIGAGVAAGLSNLYYPARERTVGKTMSKFGTNVGIDGLTFFAKEFWPDIKNALFHSKQ